MNPLPPPPPKAPVHSKFYHPQDWYKRYLPREPIYGPPQSPPPPSSPQSGPLSLDLSAPRRPVRVVHSIPVNLSTSKTSLYRKTASSIGNSFASMPWYVRLHKILRYQTDLSSTSKEVRDKAIEYWRTGPACNSPHHLLLTDLAVAKQWKQRYGEDNLKMVGFQMMDLVRMVMGRPIMVAFCDPKSDLKNEFNNA